MANLTENPAVFESGIYQIETTDPVLGGVPNVATGAGMSNIPHVQLANRTAFLKKVIDDTGLGAAAVPLVTLNSAAARLTGSYRFASGDANTPASGVAGTLEVIAASASAVNQTAFDSATTRMWTRFWNGSVWSAWSEIWRTTGVAESLTANGWQRLPSGLIMQWASGVTDVNGNMSLTLPTAFPTVFLGGIAGEANPSGWTATSTSIWAVDIPQSNLSTVFARCRTITGAAGPAVSLGINGRVLVWGR
jgi:hypothetical protein